MRPRVAIVGSGITAGLAASIMAPTNDVIVFQPTRVEASPIPEIVPRRAFFDYAGFDARAEKRIVEQAKPSVRWVAWRKRSGTRKHRLTSTDRYFVYDKGRLARALLDSASIFSRLVQDVPRIGELTGFHAVLDCRGAKGVKDDPAYDIEVRCMARTACTYIIAKRPEGLDAGTMEFWAETAPSGVRRTYYTLPFGDGMMSLGCSSTPSDRVDHQTLLARAAAVGIAIDEHAIRMLGSAEPKPTIVHNRLSHVSTLGDARGLPCPLTEYGTLSALSQILVISRGRACRIMSPAVQPASKLILIYQWNCFHERFQMHIHGALSGKRRACDH